MDVISSNMETIVSLLEKFEFKDYAWIDPKR